VSRLNGNSASFSSYSFDSFSAPPQPSQPPQPMVFNLDPIREGARERRRRWDAEGAQGKGVQEEEEEGSSEVGSGGSSGQLLKQGQQQQQGQKVGDDKSSSSGGSHDSWLGSSSSSGDGDGGGGGGAFGAFEKKAVKKDNLMGLIALKHGANNMPTAGRASSSSSPPSARVSPLLTSSTSTTSLASSSSLDSGVAAMQAAASADSDNKQRLGRTRILIVDDSVSHRKITSRTLAQMGVGFVGTAEDGQLGVEAVLEAETRQEPYTLVLMDYTMPRCDGAEAVRRIRRAGSAISVVALTGNALDDDARDMLAAGCDVVLTKPTSREELKQFLDAHFIRVWNTLNENELLPESAVGSKRKQPSSTADGGDDGGNSKKRTAN